MARLRKVVKIEDHSREWTIKELTANDIIEILQQSSFVKEESDEKESGSFVEQILGTKDDIGKLMGRCCDFTIEDIKKENLAPSEIEILYKDFMEVNKTFFETLRTLGITEALINMKDVAIENFSRVVVGSLRQDT